MYIVAYCTVLVYKTKDRKGMIDEKKYTALSEQTSNLKSIEIQSKSISLTHSYMIAHSSDLKFIKKKKLQYEVTGFYVPKLQSLVKWFSHVIAFYIWEKCWPSYITDWLIMFYKTLSPLFWHLYIICICILIQSCHSLLS